jgi:conjugative relaxase-like TrwC/TraI family protein
MLSISPPMSGAGQGNYYLTLAQEDYYLAGGEPPGRWFGNGASAFRLGATVEREQLQRLLLGQCPFTKRSLVQNAGAKDRQSGWDLTFSAPKSVSVAWSQAAPELRQKFEALHHAAVCSALSYLEDVAGFSRRGRAGANLEKVGLTCALFEHGTSRTQDPQLHTHALVLNVSKREDSSTGTIQSKDLFRHKMAAGAIYRAELASLLQKILGLNVHMKTIGFEIAGVSETLCTEFSKRRSEIEAALKGRGAHGAVASKVAALETRQSKEIVSRSALFSRWGAIGKTHGWSEKELSALLNSKSRKAFRDDKEFTKAAIDRIVAHESVFSERDLVRALAELAPEKAIAAAEVVRLAKGAIEDLVPVGLVRGERVFTTHEMLSLEKGLLQSVEESRESCRHQVSKRQAAGVLAKHPSLSSEQREAVLHITAGQGSIAVVSGMAGTGKTMMLAAASEVWKKEGFSVYGAAISGKAAQGLEAGAKVPSVTIAKLLGERDSCTPIQVKHQLIAPKAPKWSPVHGLRVPYLHINSGKTSVPLDRKSILLVDEAGMVGTRQMSALIQAVKDCGAKLVLIGDAKQLQPIEAGAPFPEVAKRLGQAELTDIRRQKDAWARELVKDSADGKAAAVIKSLLDHEKLVVKGTVQAASAKLVTDWKEQGIKSPEKNLILCGTNAEAKSFNQKAQDERFKARSIGKESVELNGSRIYQHDRVLFTKNSDAYGVKNGHLATVTKLSNKFIEARLDDGKHVRIPLDRYKHIGLGYAVTTHKSQGMTAENVFLSAGGSHTHRERSYVEVSRASKETRLYVTKEMAKHNFAALSSQMETSRRKRMAIAHQESQTHSR